jgi:hypothetical protein
MGTLNKHASNVPLLLNPETGVISTQYHVTLTIGLPRLSATISATIDKFPEFNSETWQKIFGDSTYQYMHDGDSDVDDTTENIPDDILHQSIACQSLLVEEAMARETPTLPLLVPDPLTPLPHVPTMVHDDLPLLEPIQSPSGGGNDFIWDNDRVDTVEITRDTNF